MLCYDVTNSTPTTLHRDMLSLQKCGVSSVPRKQPSITLHRDTAVVVMFL